MPITRFVLLFRMDRKNSNPCISTEVRAGNLVGLLSRYSNFVPRLISLKLERSQACNSKVFAQVSADFTDTSYDPNYIVTKIQQQQKDLTDDEIRKLLNATAKVPAFMNSPGTSTATAPPSADICGGKASRFQTRSQTDRRWWNESCKCTPMGCTLRISPH